MKKLLTFLTLLTLSIGVGWAEDVTITMSQQGWSNAEDVTGVTSGDVSIVFDAGTNTQNSPKYYNTGTGVRLYQNNTMTITANGNTITSIELTFAGTSYLGGFTANVGSYQVSGTTGTWTGSSTSVTFTAASTCRMQVVKVTYSSGGSTPTETVATPTFSPDAGTYTEAQNVTISCATSGATIYYTTDGTNPTTSSSVYSSAIAVSETTTIKAMAAASGYNNSAVATAIYTIETPQPSTSTTFERINNTSDLEAGKRYLLVYETTPAVMGAIVGGNTKYGSSVTGSNNFTLNNGVITLTDNTEAEILTLGGATNEWTFQIGDQYLYWNNGNSLGSNSSISNNTKWLIEFNNGIVSIINRYSYLTDNNRFIKYNTGSPRFACYLSGQQDIYLYKEVESTPQSSDVYIVGQINGHDSDPWNTSEGVQLTYNSSTDTYGVDIYCTGMKNGNDDGYSYFLFAKSLPFSWDNTSNLYGSGADGSYWPISGLPNESAFDEEIPLYENSKNVYRLPAGLYTVTVDLDYTHQYTDKSVKVTKRDVTLNVTNSGTFTDTKNVSMTSNLTELGGKIYYTTNGNDPRDQYSGRQEYTEQLTLDATTTIKAVAVLGCIYSDVVEKTYTKNPAAPVITPASCTFNEPLTVTITAQSGATIYYTTDGSNPTNESTQYNGPFTVSATTTVKAIAYVGEAKSPVTSATYTYSNVQPSTGDFVLVTSADQLVAGNEYIIVTTYGGTDYAMGALTTSNNPKGSRTTDFTITGTVGTSGSRITAGSEVNVLTLGSTGGAWTLKQSDESYITLGTNTNISSSSSTCALTINISNNVATIQGPDSGPSATTPRQILHQAGTSNCFGNYASSNVGGNNYSDIYLYTRASNAVQNPVFSPVPGIYNVDIDVTISCATDGATIYYTTDGSTPSATNGTQFNEDDEILVSESTTFKAIAVKDGNTSSVVTAEYTIQKSTDIATVTLTYSEPFTAGIGDFTINNVSGFSPVWSLDGNYGVKGTSYSNGTNYAAVSRLVSPIIDMTGSVQPELSFSHQINKYFTDPTTQCQVFIRETTNGTSGTWVQIPITFSDPVAAGGWTNDVVDIDLTDINGVSYADKKVQISFLYTNPTAGTGAGTWEIQNFVVADNSEYRMVNNIAEFLALENGTKAKFKNPVTVLYDYAQYSSSQYHEYIWVKDESGFMQFYTVPTLNYDENNATAGKAAYYENGDIIPAGFVVTKNYYEYGKYVQAYTNDALNADFAPATQKGLADPEFMDFDNLHTLDATDAEDVATWCNRYITLEKIKIASKSGKNFTFANENGTVNACVGYNKYNGDGSLLKGGTESADVTVPPAGNTYYDVKGIIQLWQGGWEFMPIEFTEWKAEEVTLRKLCADGEEGEVYVISNNLLGVYASEDGTMLWVKDDDGQSIFEKDPEDPFTDNFAIEYDGNTRLEQAHYDQSNWCLLIMADENAGDFVGKIIKGGSIEGRFTDKTNPTLDGVSLDEDAIYSDGSYAPNYYIPANFYGDQSCNTSQHGQPGHGDYFFMAPKPQEYAMIVWAVWNSQSEQFIMSTDPNRNTHMFEGGFSISFELNTGASSYQQLQDGYGYDFQAIIRKPSSTTGAKATGDFVVYPLDLDEGQNPTTSINDINAGNGVVKSVKYVNVAGMVSDTPFQGVNIVVTEYTDGTRTTTKMLRK